MEDRDAFFPSSKLGIACGSDLWSSGGCSMLSLGHEDVGAAEIEHQHHELILRTGNFDTCVDKTEK